MNILRIYNQKINYYIKIKIENILNSNVMKLKLYSFKYSFLYSFTFYYYLFFIILLLLSKINKYIIYFDLYGILKYLLFIYFMIII